MRLPSVAPVQGTVMSNVFQSLGHAHQTFVNGFNGRAPQVLEHYQRAAVQAADSLGYSFSATDVEKMILTRRHWLLMSMVATPGNEPIIHDLVRVEAKAHADYLDALVKQLRAIDQRWANSTVRLVMPDTNVYIHQDFFEKIDWPAMVGGSNVLVIVPMQVVRELDQHKNGPRNAIVRDGSDETVRVRARNTVKRLRELFVDPAGPVPLRPGVHIELLMDAPGHQPLEDADSEIIDRALALSSAIQQPVCVATGDGGMDFAAKIEGLKVIGL